MSPRPSTLERAFELAASGKVGSITELRRQLSREGFSDARPQTDGAAIMRQLTDMMRRAQAAPESGAAEAPPSRQTSS